MPIDPNIPLQVKPFNIQLPVNQLAAVGEAMKIGEMNRGIEEQNKLNEYLRSGVDLSKPETRSELVKYGKTGLAYGKALGEQEKLGFETKKLGVETKIKELEVQREQFGNLVFNPSNSNVTAHIEDSVLKGNMPPAQAQALLAQVMPMNADQRKQFFTDMAIKAETRFQGDVTKRGQDIQATTTRRGQDISAESARRGQDLGRIPVGYRMTPEGTLEAMPGGPTTTNLSSKEIQARESKYPVATQAVNTFEAKTDQLEKDLLTLKNHPGLASITGIVAGRAPAVTKEGREAQALYDKIVARGGFKELQDMRAASPTGGALGNVSNQEGTQLRQSFAAIDRRQDASSVQNAISDAIADLQGSKSRVREAYDMTYDYKGAKTPAPTPPPAPGAGGSTVTIPGGKVLTFPTPEAAAAYKKAAGL
jgi:hypothetical protein